MSGIGGFFNSAIQSFMQVKQAQSEKEEQKKERQAKVKLFEIQLEREQRAAKADAAKQSSLEQLTAKFAPPQIRGTESPATMGPPVSQQGPPDLASMMADPSVLMLMNQAGIDPNQFAPKQATKSDAIRILEDPELYARDLARRKAGASQVNVSQGGEDLPKPPTNFYRPTAGKPGLAAEPGGPAAMEAAAAAAKDANALRSVTDKVSTIETTIGDAKSLVGILTTGLGGKQFARIEGTDAYNLGKKLETIKANLGFDELQKMREASPTGGALGQVAVQELNSLQATIASLDQFQDGKELTKALNSVDTHYKNWKKAVSAAKAKLPSGIPSGSTFMREFNGKPVYRTPEGKLLVVE